MLKVLGTLYSDNTDDFNKMAQALKDAGYILAYRYQNNADVIEETPDESEDQTT